MPPLIATIFCSVFVAWLVFRDIRTRHTVSAAIWIPCLWAFILGSRPVSAWPIAATFGLSSNMASTADYVEGSPFDRLVFLALIALGCVVLMKRRTDWQSLAKFNKWLVIYFVYLAASALWSDYSFVSFKRWIKDFGNVIMLLVVLSERDPLEAVKAFLARTAYTLIPLSVLLIKYYPSLSRYYDQWTYQPYFCGAATDKNLFGASLFVCAVGVCWLWSSSSAQGVKRSRFEPLSYGSLLLLASWLLLKSSSATSVVCTLMAISFLLCSRSVRFRMKVDRLGRYFLVSVVIGIFVHLAFGFEQIFKSVIGRDLTFTGRTDIWGMLLKEEVNPVFGEGFYSFWLGDRVERLSDKYFYHLNEAHNGYLETYLNSGLVGLALLAVLLFSTGAKLRSEIKIGRQLAILQFGFLIAGLVYNFTEAGFDRLNLVWVAMVLGMLRIPAESDAEVPSDILAYKQSSFSGSHNTEAAT